MAENTPEELQKEIAGLRRRLAVATLALRVFRRDSQKPRQIQHPAVGALGTGDRFYRDLVEQMHQAAIAVDTIGRIVYCNRRFLELLHQQQEKVIGTRLVEFVAHADRLLLEPLLREGHVRGSQGEIRFLKFDCSLVAAYLTISPLVVEGDSLLGVLITDLTEPRRQEELIAAERLARSILDQAVDVIVVCNSEGQIIRASRGAFELCKYNPLRQPFEIVFPLEINDCSTSSPLNESMSATGQRHFQHLGSSRVIRGQEVCLQRRDNVNFDLLLSAGPLSDATGKRIGTVVTMTDITEQKRAEAALRFIADASEALAASLDYNRTLSNVAHQAVPFLADCCFFDLVASEDRIHRVTWTHAVRGRKPWFDKICRYVPPTSIHQHPIRNVLRSGAAEYIEVVTEEWIERTAVDPEHKQFLIDLDLRSQISVPLMSRDRTLGALTLCYVADSGRRYNTVDLHAAEELGRRAAVAIENATLYRELQEADRRKDDFLAMLAHELRNPLGPIRTAVQVLKLLRPAETNIEQSREIIERQVSHMAHLIDDLLDVSRISRGKILLRRDLVDLAQVLRTTAEDYSTTFESAGIELHAVIPEHPHWVIGDATRIAQMIGNLLHNALKFTDAGGEVTVRLSTDAGKKVVVSVLDTGIGMEPDMLTRVFETFSQADRSLDRSRGGLGLGLALVKGLALLHGGTLNAMSHGLGTGSEFILVLPQELPPEIQPVPEAQPKSHVRQQRILVIEDNQDAAESMRMLLALMGNEVRIAHTGEDGVDVAREFEPTVVLCDIGLPGKLDGYAVANTLSEAVKHPMYLVALTGYGQDDDLRKAREAGFHLHLTKPIDFARLQRALESISAKDPWNDF